jgi:hypothetical protein
MTTTMRPLRIAMGLVLALIFASELPDLRRDLRIGSV